MKFGSFLILFVIAFFRFVTVVHGQDSTGRPGQAKLYFIRHTGYNASALNFHCFIDSQLVCNLRNKRFSVHDVTPGTHALQVRIYSKEPGDKGQPLIINAVAGNTYYIRLLPTRAYSFKGDDPLLEVSESTARPLLAKSKEEQNCLK